jgi:hypothetical protein
MFSMLPSTVAHFVVESAVERKDFSVDAGYVVASPPVGYS